MPNVDMDKRRRIMRRSMKLGHCICDPKRPCPCDIFTEQGICPCAGERPVPKPIEDVKLTELVHNAGCASKIAPGDLERILSRLPVVNDPAVISGIPAGDDAGIYKLTDDVTLVQTIDVFTPCVDDPYTFGRICAANCLSDIYAMGGVPRTAVSVVGFPAEKLDGQIMYQMMKGAMATLAEAGVALIGGHSIKDDEIKLGFAITGTLDTSVVATERSGANVGDLLVLTKPLGVGVLNFANQIGRGDPAGLTQACESMAQLNHDAAEAMTACRASSCTDITGFGLFGHLIGMARDSGVTMQVFADNLPAFDGALDALAAEIIPGAIERNTEHVGDDIRVAEGIAPERVYLGYDSQTSGGLLIAIAPERHGKLLAALAARDTRSVTVGKVVAESTGRIVVTQSDQPAEAAGAFPNEGTDMPGNAPKPTDTPAEKSCCDSGPAAEPCCADAATPAPASCCDSGPAGSCCDTAPSSCAEPIGTGVSGTSADATQGFGAMMRAVGAAGAIDAKAKELINFALVVFSRCDPCIAVHMSKARKMGITRAELDEAAWCAIAMGGAPVKMFYAEALNKYA